MSELPALYLSCELSLAGTRTPRERVSSSNSRQEMPFNAEAAEVRSSVRSVLASWASLVAQERGLDAPQRDVVQMARFIHENIPWLSGHSAAGEAVEEFSTLTRRARRASEPRAVRVVPLGDCMHPSCTGKLRAVVKVVSGTRSKPSEIRCSVDDTHWWASDEWAALAACVQSHTTSRRAWYSVSDIAALWNMPNGSIYRLASQYRWRRRKVSGKVFYHASDVNDAQKP
ncbi:hypothetical protein OG753_08105 [Streptomyces sp. NBC_00029]|uniref:hypothetical protein n=1 Tax=Streptomyces sp. NBC_00029 TaxID=2903613 RepID=UPI003245C24D